MFEKFKVWLVGLNTTGVPIPLLRDPKTGTGSVTLTMYWIAFNVSILTLAGKLANLAGGIDYSSVLWLYGLTGGMYLGRKFQAGKDGITVESESKE